MTDNHGSKSELLEQRMLEFATSVIENIRHHQKRLPFSVAGQLTRFAASVGANYAEACNASSKQDFRNKIFIFKKEAAESRYWIKLCGRLTEESSWAELLQESHEILLILQTIINSLKPKSET